MNKEQLNQRLKEVEEQHTFAFDPQIKDKVKTSIDKADHIVLVLCHSPILPS